MIDAQPFLYAALTGAFVGGTAEGAPYTVVPLSPRDRSVILGPATKSGFTVVSVSLDSINTLSAKLVQLRAMLLTISWARFSSFLELDSQEQGNVLWLASEPAGEARSALAGFSGAREDMDIV